MSVLRILKELSDTSSRKEKESILNAYKDNVDLRNAFYFAYSPSFDYYITDVAMNPFVATGESSLTDVLLNIYQIICSRSITGHAARDC